MEKILNYTNRSDDLVLSGENPELKINILEEEDNTFFNAEIKILEEKYPKDCKIFIQPYTTAGYVGKPVDYGTVGVPSNQKILEPNGNKNELKFRFKIIENTSNKIKKVLCFIDNIQPYGSKNLLTFGEKEQDSIFILRIMPNEVPEMIFKKGLGLKSDIKNSHFLKGILFTSALREILQKYIIETEKFEECKIRDDYIKKFEKLTKQKFPKKDENESEEIEDWINLAIDEFSNEKKKKNKSLVGWMPKSSVELEKKLTYRK